MAEILSVEVGDQFGSVGTSTTLEVVKIWFAFNMDENRWETSVTWRVTSTFSDSHLRTAKGREFVQNLRDGCFVRVEKEEFSFNVTMAPSAPVVTTAPPAPSPADRQRKQWEDDFRRNAVKYGLSPSDLGRRVTLSTSRSRYFTIVGAKPRNWKLPILVQNKRGKVYKIAAEKAKAGLV